LWIFLFYFSAFTRNAQCHCGKTNSMRDVAQMMTRRIKTEMWSHFATITWLKTLKSGRSRKSYIHTTKRNSYAGGWGKYVFRR
jgi:hypothetical protein